MFQVCIASVHMHGAHAVGSIRMCVAQVLLCGVYQQTCLCVMYCLFAGRPPGRLFSGDSDNDGYVVRLATQQRWLLMVSTMACLYVCWCFWQAQVNLLARGPQVKVKSLKHS